MTEFRLILFLALVQFVNILDFMMVMPLGPDFARALGVNLSHLGIVGGSYTAAAAVAGFASSFFLDRFDRKKALLIAMSGLVVGTLCGAFAFNLTTLVAARVLAGIFGGPASALSLAIVSDAVPGERRGRAIGKLMSAFSVASILGVPMGLELARYGTWQTPFYAVAALGAIVVLVGVFLLPSFTAHISQAAKISKLASMKALLRMREVQVAYGLTATVMAGSFMIIPNIASYIQFNLGYPRNSLGMLYLFGGVASFITMPLAGRFTDSHGPILTGTLGTVLVLFTMYCGFGNHMAWMVPSAIFVLFMISTSMRNVAFGTICSKVPTPQQRASFLSLQSAIQHLSTAFGAFVASQLLTTNSDGMLEGMASVTWFAMAITFTLPLFLVVLQSLLTARSARSPSLNAF